MDLLSRRYASPFLILNCYIQTKRFCEFIDEFAEAVQESNRYELYLHKVWDRSYLEFKEDVQTTQQNRHLSEGGFETTIKHSMNILNNFNPEQNGGD